MARGRRGHRDHVHLAQEGVQVVEHRRAQGPRQGFGPLGMGVHHRRQPHALEGRALARMVAAEHAGADHTCSQDFGHTDSSHFAVG